MAWTDEQLYYALYVIGAVESDWDYGATNQTDAITVGIAQWYGGRAAALIERLRSAVPESYAVLSQRIRDAIEAESTNWTRFYLLLDDAQSWRAASEVEGNHELQEQQFMDDMSGYLDTLAYWGVNTDNVKSTIFYVSMYHQSPQGCLSVVQAYGGDRDIDTLYAAAMNSPTFGLYKNRYGEVRDLLKKWDGTSAPPDFGQEGGVTPEEPGGSGETVESAVSYLQLVGNDIIVYGGKSTTDRLLCHNTGRDIWLPVGGTLPTDPGTTPPPSGGDPEDFPAMRALWEQHERQFHYGNGAGRLSPTTSGYTDCSAGIWWAANAATNNKYDWLGTRSYEMVETCPTVFDVDFTKPLDLSRLKPGDIIAMSYSGLGYSGGHVDWYWGDGVIWTSGYSYGGDDLNPRQITTDAANYYYNFYINGTYNFNWLKICRFL